MTNVLLVRHGQSEWNAAGRWQGQADPPLTELGIQQARVAASNLPDFDHLAASSLTRARQTALTIASTLGTPAPTFSDGLVERDLGNISGLTRDEINERFPGVIEHGRWPAGCETNDQLLCRVQDALRALTAELQVETLVIITHGGVIYALESLFDVIPNPIANLGGRWFDISPTELNIGKRVRLISSVDETTPQQL